MNTLTPDEEAVFNRGERMIPWVTHDIHEVIRHYSSYEFFRRIVRADLKTGDCPEVVDLGCGSGYGCRMFSALPGAHVVGVDVSEAALGYARSHYSEPNITYQAGSLVEFISQMSECDYAVARNVLEHIPNGLDLALAIKWSRRLLFDVPFAEPAGGNPHHVIHGIGEEQLTGRFGSAELFYQDLAGRIYDAAHKPQKPNVLVCVVSAPGLPMVGELFEQFGAIEGVLAPLNHLEKGDSRLDEFPTVSIITAADGQRLTRTIANILGQDYPRVEAVAVDIGPSGTAEAATRSRDRVAWKHLPGASESQAFNEGLSRCTTDIVAALPVGTSLLPVAVGDAVERLNKDPELIGVYGDWQEVDDLENVMRRVSVPDFDLTWIIKWHLGPGPVLFLRRRAFLQLQGYDERLSSLGNMDLFWRAAQAGLLARLPQVLSARCPIPNNASARQSVREHVLLVKKTYSSPNFPDKVRQVEPEAYSGAHYAAGLACGKARWWQRKWHFLAAILYLFPFPRKHRHAYSERIAVSARELVGPLYPMFRMLLRSFFVARPPTGGALQ